MSWSQRRKATYGISIFSILAIIIIFAVFFVFFNKKVSCDDGIKNQGEQGIDCGGPCQMLCRASYVSPNVLWTRASKVLSSGAYNALIYSENPNINSGAYNVPFGLKIYDKNSVLIAEKYGNTYIPPNKSFAIFLDNIFLNDKVPARIKFEFSNDILWQKIESKELSLSFTAKVISNENDKPKVSAVITNKSLKPIANIEIVAILYDENNNAIAFSKTKVDSLDKEASQDIVFTWPEKFYSKVYKIELVPKVLGN